MTKVERVIEWCKSLNRQLPWDDVLSISAEKKPEELHVYIKSINKNQSTSDCMILAEYIIESEPIENTLSFITLFTHVVIRNVLLRDYPGVIDT